MQGITPFTVAKYLQKGGNPMDWLNNMNNAINYIESHLADEVSYDRAAQHAHCSTHHFQRMFSFLMGVPLSEYIRRRRLTLAALDLQTSGIKVIDVALKYGYDSPEAFSRAFKKLHGIMPISARDMGVSLKAFPRMTFNITVKGAIEMNYRIQQREAFEVFGIELKTTVIDGKCFQDIPKFIGDCINDGRYAALLKAAGKHEVEGNDVGVTYGHNPNGDMNYMLGCFKKAGPTPPGYVSLHAPSQTWAVFAVDWAGEGDDANLHDTWEKIYSEWFPSVNYEHSEYGFDFELYSGSNDTGFSAEIWIPVVKK